MTSFWSDQGKLMSAVENVLGFHQLAEWDYDHTQTRCRGCYEVYPCPTVKALAGALGVQGSGNSGENPEAAADREPSKAGDAR